jgi:hypothetical protein
MAGCLLNSLMRPHQLGSHINPQFPDMATLAALASTTRGSTFCKAELLGFDPSTGGLLCSLPWQFACSSNTWL